MEFKDVKVLAIDDNNDNLITIKVLVEEHLQNVTVYTANSGAKGLELAKTLMPDAILLDVVMPIMDGFETCKRLKSDPNLQHIPVVFVTAIKDDKASRVKALELGAEAFLAKPIDESELVAQLRAMVKLKRNADDQRNVQERLEALVAERTSELETINMATLNLLEDLRKENEIRRKAEAELAQSNALYQSIVETSPDEITLTDLEGNIILTSNISVQMLGYNAQEDIIGKNMLELVYVTDLPYAMENFRKMLLTPLGPKEYRMKKKDGGFLFVEVNGNVVYDLDGKPSKLLFVSRDVTERHISQQKLQESEALYRAILNASPDSIIISDTVGKVIMASESAVKNYGFDTSADVIGQDIRKFTSAEDLERMVANFEEMKAGIHSGPHEYKSIKKDGTVFDIEVKGGNIYNSEGEIRGLVFIARDVSERKIEQRRLLESEEKYRSIFENSPYGILYYDIAGKIIDCNESFVNLLGSTRAKLIGLDTKKLKNTKIVAAIQASISGESCAYDDVYVSETGARSPYIKAIFTPIKLEDGSIMGGVGLVEDVTTIRESERLVKKSEMEFRAVWENASNGLRLTNAEGVIVRVNDAFCRIFGVERSHIEGKTIADLYPVDDKAHVIEMHQQRFATRNVAQHIEKELTLWDGAKKWVEVDNSFVDIEGQPTLLLGIFNEITQRKNAIVALENSEQKYRDLINNSPEGITIYVDNKIAFINNAAWQMMRASSPDDMLGHPVTDFIHPDNHELVLQRMFFVSQAPVNMILPAVEEKYLRLDGTEVYAEIKVMPIMYEGQKAIQIIGHDISERKKAELELERNRIELKTIYDNAPVMMCVLNEKRSIQFANNAFSDYIGLKEALLNNIDPVGVFNCINAIGNPNGCGASDNCTGCVLRLAMEDSLNTGRTHNNIEFSSKLVINNVEQEVYLLASTALIETDAEKRLLLCFTDISERKETEKALQRSEMFLRTFIDNVPFMIWARDTNNVGILENKKLVEDFGSSLGKKPDDQDIDDAAREVWLQNNKRVMKGEIINDEIIYTIKGEDRYYHQICFPIKLNNEIIGIAGFNIDITDKKIAEEALVASQIQLKEFAAHLQNVREEERILLSREIHDELGQILVAVKFDLGMLQLRTKAIENDAAAAEIIELMKHMAGLIDNTIKAARRIMTDLRPAVLDMLGPVDAIRQHVQAYAEHQQINCSFTSELEQLALSPQQAVALFRIVQEALTNIAKHALASEVQVQILRVDKGLELTIVDNGIGFDSTRKARVDSFGLLGMKERAYLLDGEVSITSTPGKGTAVKLVIPYEMKSL